MSATVSTARPASNRWMQLLFGIISMMLIANLQYGWTLFVQPIKAAHDWSIAEIQVGVQHLHRARDLAHPGRRLAGGHAWQRGAARSSSSRSGGVLVGARLDAELATPTA